MDDFEAELKSGFLEEVTQLLVDAEQCFLDLETNPQDIATLEKLFRIAHNVKGSSKAVGFDALGAFTHEFESFMLKCKSGQIPILPSTVSLLLKCNDHVKNWIESLKADLAAILDNGPLIAEIHGFQAGEAPAATAPEEAAPAEEAAVTSTPAEPEVTLEATLNATMAEAEALMASMNETTPAPAEVKPVVEETFTPEEVQAVQAPQSAKPSQPVQTTPPPVAAAPPPVAPEKTPAPVVAAADPHAAAPAAAHGGSASGAKAVTEESIRVSLSRLEKLINFVGEMVILQTVLKEQVLTSNPQTLVKTIHQMGKVTKEVQEISMSLRMVPLKQTFQKMQRIVRDTSSLLGKKVQFVLEGEETEVDKTVLEALSDPLVHLIRNAVDHGIESPEDRVKKGKNETGQIILRAYHQSGRLVIEIKDNGGGIQAERLKQKAIEKGILKPGQVMADKDAVNLIFHSGFSTKTEVTEISGRGVGMDVVKTNIEAIQGEIIVETVVNEGSTFKVVLPLTLAIIDGMVIRCGQERFVVPLSHVYESMKPEPKDLRFTTGMGEVLLLRGENLPVVRLSHALGKNKGKSTTEQIAIIVRAQGKPFAALVDDVIGQYQVVIKKLGAEMQHLRGYSGSAILGDGKPALILELGDLFSSAPASGAAKRAAA